MDRRLRYGLAAGAALLAAAAAAPFLVPTGVYKARIEQSVSQATGRAFRINGSLHLSLLPTFGLSAEDATLANMAGGRAPALAAIKEVRVGAQLLPLLSGRLEMSEIVLDRPEIHLEVDAQGHANWTLARAPTGAPSPHAPRPALEMHLSGIRIVHGSVSYDNARTGDTRHFEDIDATVALTALDRPTAATGAFEHAGRRVTFAATLATPQLLLQERQTALDVSLTSDLLSAGFKGSVTPEGTASGHLTVASPSIREAGEWLGAKLPAGGGLGPFSLDSRIDGDNRVATFTGMTLRLDGATLHGDISLNTGGGVPAVKGTLAVDRLDVNPYIEARTHAARPHPRVGTDEGWSDTPLALDVLRKFDAELTLDAGQVAVKHLRLGRSRIALSLNGGHLIARLDPVTLYGGTGKALLDVDAAGDVPVFRDRVAFDRVALAPFLTDTMGVTRIEGTGTLALDLAARGANAQAVMRGLSGTGRIAFHDGRLRGVDLGGVAKSIATFLGGATAPDALTRYSDMGGSFRIANGVLASDDFRLTGPLVSTTGNGTVDIGDRAIDFRIVPQASADVAGRHVTIGVPFHIKGPWQHVRYTADVGNLVKGVLDNLESGRAPFKGLFGGAPKPVPDASPRAAETPPENAAAKKKHKSLGNALKNMLGIH